MANEQSVGAVIRHKPMDIAESPQFLLLKNRRGFWGFPQGHKEKGETEIQTLLREVKEETGISELDIQSYIGKINYSYYRGRDRSEKEVSFYFATTPTKEVMISEEHADFVWATLKDAFSLLGHAKLRQILDSGHRRGLY